MRPQLPPGTCLRSNGLYGKFRSRKLLDADQPVDAVDASCEREHQREGVLRAGDIGSPAHPENLHAGSDAGRDIDISKQGAVFVNDLELGGASKLLRSHGEGFDDQCARGRKIGMQFRMGGHEPNLAGIEPSCARSELLAPAREIRHVGRHEVGKSGASLLRRRGVEHHADQATSRDRPQRPRLEDLNSWDERHREIDLAEPHHKPTLRQRNVAQTIKAPHMSDISKVVSIAIHPAIGFARVGTVSRFSSVRKFPGGIRLTMRICAIQQARSSVRLRGFACSAATRAATSSARSRRRMRPSAGPCTSPTQKRAGTSSPRHSIFRPRKESFPVCDRSPTSCVIPTSREALVQA